MDPKQRERYLKRLRTREFPNGTNLNNLGQSQNSSGFFGQPGSEDTQFDEQGNKLPKTGPSKSRRPSRKMSRFSSTSKKRKSKKLKFQLSPADAQKKLEKEKSGDFKQDLKLMIQMQSAHGDIDMEAYYLSQGVDADEAKTLATGGRQKKCTSSLPNHSQMERFGHQAAIPPQGPNQGSRKAQPAAEKALRRARVAVAPRNRSDPNQ